MQGVEDSASTADGEIKRGAPCPSASTDAAQKRARVHPVPNPAVDHRFVSVDRVIAPPLVDHEEKAKVGHPSGEHDAPVCDRIDGGPAWGGDQNTVPDAHARGVGLAEDTDQLPLGWPGESPAEARERERDTRRPGNRLQGVVEAAEETRKHSRAREEEVEKRAVARDFPLQGGEQRVSLRMHGREVEELGRFARSD